MSAPRDEKKWYWYQASDGEWIRLPYKLDDDETPPDPPIRRRVWLTLILLYILWSCAVDLHFDAKRKDLQVKVDEQQKSLAQAAVLVRALAQQNRDLRVGVCGERSL